MRLIGPKIKIWRRKQKLKCIGIFSQKIKNMEGGTKGNLKNNFSNYRFLLLTIVEYDEKYLLEKNYN